MSELSAPRPAHDYIVVGSGAGGGTLAARLAEASHSVLLLEAGGDPLRSSDERLPEDYQVPAFHAFAAENPAMRWDFFVHHYTEKERRKKDLLNYTAERDGVLYPRAGTFGGCTAHNAMILIYPHNSDWDHIAKLTGDPSWSGANMRKYFELLEDCRHRPLARWLKKAIGLNPSRHGFDGWLTTEVAIPMEALENRRVRKILEKLAVTASSKIGNRFKRLRWFFKTRGDPNDWLLVKSNSYGLRILPLTTRNHVRIGAGDRVRSVAEKYRDKLTIEYDALATRVIFDGENRAIGVEYLKGERLYRAHAKPSSDAGGKFRALAAKEVLLCGGAFNTPQILMLSGVGPREELARHKIKVLVDLPVGKNLQDRYEVSVVNRMKDEWEMMAGAKFAKGDPQYREWQAEKKGVYATNGGVLAVIKTSRHGDLPDLFCLGLVGKFQGYSPGYSKLIAEHRNYLSWIVLKAHTLNNAGTVTLESSDPRDPPKIEFRYFDEGSDREEKDLEAVVEGIEFVRAMTKDLRERGLIVEEELPGDRCRSDSQLKEFVRDNAWGHHASCTCPIGPREKGGVLSSDFRVHGTRGLRVVDASVFPRIPGFFIVSAVYMIGEKAADVILAGAKS